MGPTLFKQLQQEGYISEASLEKLEMKTIPALFSVYWELRIILYLGVLLLSTGLGILVYKNIDSIGHTAVLTFIALISGGGFFYCFKKKLPFSPKRIESPHAFFDYALLLACLSFILLIGYWQYRYQVFGNRFGLLTFIPMLLLFFSAYFFDQLAILSLAITNLAAWAGIVVTPTRILVSNDFDSSTIIITGIALGLVLLAAEKATRRTGIKSHFAFTYVNFGMNILFISCLAGLFHFDAIYGLFFLLLAGIAGYFYNQAMRERSFYFLLMAAFYFYVGLSYVVLHFLYYTAQVETGSFYTTCLYFVGSATILVIFLDRMNRKLRQDDRIQ